MDLEGQFLNTYLLKRDNEQYYKAQVPIPYISAALQTNGAMDDLASQFLNMNPCLSHIDGNSVWLTSQCLPILNT